METAVQEVPTENLSFNDDPRPDIIREKTTELQRRKDIINAINAERGFEGYIYNTNIMEGYIKGLRDSLQMAPPPAPPAAPESEVANHD